MELSTPEQIKNLLESGALEAERDRPLKLILTMLIHIHEQWEWVADIATTKE